jgi:putative oxidoreductase
MLQSVAMRMLIPLALRAALASVFIYHGLAKVQPENGYGFRWHTNALVKMNQPESAALPTVLQAVVGWGELLGGCAIALGILTRVAALGIIAIMVGAIVTVHGQRGFGMETGGFEYNFVLIMVALCLVLGGAGTFSLDRVIQLKSRGPAQY